MRPINRITPALANPMAYKTFAISQPAATHFRPGTCAEAECGPHVNGWASIIDESTDLGRRQAYYIRKRSGRRFAEHRNEAGMTVFTFEPGQSCFASDSKAHLVPLERPVNHYVWSGDWRVTPNRQDVTPMRGEDWVDAFANHQDKLKSTLERG